MVKRKAAAKKAAKPAPAKEPERDKATGAIGVDVQDHTGPEDLKAERTIRSKQVYTRSLLPKGPWQHWKGKPGSGMEETIMKLCRVPALFECIDAAGESTVCVDGFVQVGSDGDPVAVPAEAVEGRFDLMAEDPKN